MDLWDSVRVTEMLAAVGVVVSSLEVLARHRVSAPGAWNAWEIARRRMVWTRSGPVAAVLDVFLGYRGERMVVAGRAVVAVVLAVGGLPYGWHTGALWVVTVCFLLRNLRSAFHGVGSDQMFLVVYGSLAVGFTCGVPQVSLWAVAGQACTAYLVSGLWKAVARGWRDGTALSGVLGTVTWGHPGVGALLVARPVVARLVSGVVIVGESSFPLVLAAPVPVVPVVLGVAAAFHAGAAVVMGLNGFLWAFVACYPAVAYVAGAL